MRHTQGQLVNLSKTQLTAIQLDDLENFLKTGARKAVEANRVKHLVSMHYG